MDRVKFFKVGWMKANIKKIRKAITQQSNEDQNKLIKIHPYLLNKLIEAPMLTKGRYVELSLAITIKAEEEQHSCSNS